MAALTPRKGAIKNIAFMALMCAVNALFSVLAAFVPLSAVFLCLFLPLSSALVGFYCEGKYAPIYLSASIALSLGCTAWDLSSALFYTTPAILTGFAYGFLKKIGLGSAWTIFVVALLNGGLAYLSMPLIRLMYEIDMEESLLALIGISESEFAHTLFPSAVLAFSLAQIALVSLFIDLAWPKLAQEKQNGFKIPAVFTPIMVFFLSLLVLLFGFLNTPTSYFFLTAAVYWTVQSSFQMFPATHRWLYFVYMGFFLAGFACFAGCFSLLPDPLGLLLFATFLSAWCLGALLQDLLLWKQKSALKIKTQEEKGGPR